MLYATCLLFFVSSICLADPIADGSDAHSGSSKSNVYDFGSCANSAQLMPPSTAVTPSSPAGSQQKPKQAKAKK